MNIEKKIESRDKVITVKEDVVKFVIELNEEEAKLLHMVLGSIIGSGQIRKLTNAMYNDLSSKGISSHEISGKHIKTSMVLNVT